MRSLIVAPQWIGDAVMTEPLLRHLHARGEQLTVAALPWVAPVYRAMPQVHEVFELPFGHGGLQWAERRRIGRSWRGRFDRAYVCPNSFKSALIPWWAGIPERIGYQGEARWGVLNLRLPNPSRAERPPMLAWYGALACDGGPGEGERPRLTLAATAVAQVLAPWQLVLQSYVVLAPGAEYGEAKRWPVAHFAELTRRLTLVPGLAVVLLGSGKEADLCQQIAVAAQGLGAGQATILNLAGRTTLAQALALIAGARALVSNDSGLMHVGAAFGISQVAVFGSSSPRHTPPLNPLARVLWLKDDPAYTPPLDCAPCFARTCPLGHTRCLHDVTPQAVLAALPGV